MVKEEIVSCKNIPALVARRIQRETQKTGFPSSKLVDIVTKTMVGRPAVLSCSGKSTLACLFLRPRGADETSEYFSCGFLHRPPRKQSMECEAFAYQ